MPEQRVFAGIDVVSPNHAVAEDEVAVATNIDFSLSRGALACRRGSVDFVTPASTQLKGIYRFYNSADINAGPFYVNGSNGVTYRGTAAGVYTSIVTGGASDQIGFSSYRTYAYIASDTHDVKDDGTNTTDWIMEAPGSFSNFSITTNTYFYGATVFAAIDGGITGSASSGSVWTTTFTSDPNTNRAAITFNVVNSPPDLTTSSPPAYSYESIDLSFSDPSQITRISFDYSVGGTDFTTYLHTEILPTEATVVNTADLDALTNQLTYIGVGTDSSPLTFEQKQTLINQINSGLRFNQSILSNARNNLTPWITNRLFNWVISGYPATSARDPWLDIQAGRIIIEANGTLTCTAGNNRMLGGKNPITGGIIAPLNDIYQGYTYWRTYVSTDTASNVVAESAPSGPYGPFKMQYAQFKGTFVDTLVSSNGINATVIYRQGGLATVPYAVATISLATSGTQTHTFTDTTYDLDQIQQNFAMETQNNWVPNNWPGDVVTISEPFHDRLFLGYENRLAWTLPGQPYAVPKTSNVVVSSGGDTVKNLIVWQDRIVVVNRDSVFELGGDIFEGPQANWVLQRSGSKHGAISARTTIKTPYGILLLDFDGLYMYVPGQGIDQPIEWANQKLADIFRGNGSQNPAAEKGNRIQAINESFLIDCSAAYNDGKIYVAAPTGTSSTASSVYVLEMGTKRCWYYEYPFSIVSMFWDKQANRLFAGTTTGAIVQLEIGNGDRGAAIAWTARTRAFTAATDSLLETVSVEFQGGGTARVLANLDGTATVTAGTLTATNRQWYNLSLLGTVANYVDFQISGTQTSTFQNMFTGLGFDLYPEPKRLTYFRTEQDVYQGFEVTDQASRRVEMQWDTIYVDNERLNLGTSTDTTTVTAVSFVDNVAVMTNTMVSPSGGRVVNVYSFPPETYGYVAYTTFTSTDTAYPFKIWTTKHTGRPEPPRVNSEVTDRQPSKVEQWYHRSHSELGIYGSGTDRGVVTAVRYVDEVALDTQTYTATETGTGSRLVYVSAYPFETYGRIVHIRYTAVDGSLLKHYNTWYESTDEPDRVLLWETPHKTVPSENYIKTWVAELNPLGGTVIGTMYVEDDVSPLLFPAGYVAVATVTFTGTTRHIFECTVPNITTGKTVKAHYQSTSVFKHYGSDWELEPKPFGKTNWLVTYRKLGGATQLDMLRYWAYDIEAPITSTITSVWTIDNLPFATNTIVVSGRQYVDQLPFPPGGRGYLFQQTMEGDQPFKVWKSNLDLERVAVKGFSRLTLPGTPQ